MDGSVPTQQSVNNDIAPQRKKTSDTLFFEIIFIAVLIIVVFGALSYFNILPLSNLWPNQFGFLPHQQSKQEGNVTMKQHASSTGGLNNAIVSPSEQAKEALTSFIPTVIAPSFVPKSSSDIVFVQGKTVKDDFLAAWGIKDGKAAVRFMPSPNGNQIVSLYILFDYNTDKPVSPDLAKETIPQFFLPAPKEKFACKPLSNGSNYCESFWEEPNGTKRGVGIQENSPSSKDSKRINVFFCEFTKETTSYPWKSCAPEFAQTGVQ